MAIRVLLVEDNEVYRSTLELLLDGRDGIEIVGSVADGRDAAAAAERLDPDVVLMDFRLPGLDGAQATAAVRAADSDDGDPLPHGRGDRRRSRGGARGRGRRADREGQLDRRPRPGRPCRQPSKESRAREPDRREHRDRARLDLRLPRRRGAVPEHARRAALRQLRRRRASGTTSTSARTTSTSACARHRRCRRPRSRRRRTSSTPTSSSRATSGSTRCSSRRSSRAPSSPPSRRPAEVGGDRIRVVDTETASLAVGLLALAIQRRLARGTTDEEIEALIERFKEENGVVFTVATLEYLQKGGRIGRAQALAGTLLNVKPILSIDDGVVHPIGKVRGRQKALEEFARVFTSATENVPGPARRRSPTRTRRSGSRC